jgi:hypothetical protein
MDPRQRLDAIRTVQRLLDEAFRIPGTRVRFGWDALVGLLPWAGDTLTALMGSVILFQAHQMRVPRIVQLRMLLNLAIDLAVGLVPFAGDVADVFWKANTRNVVLLERHAGQAGRPSAGDWIFVGAVIAVILAIAAVPFILLVWLASVVAG